MNKSNSKIQLKYYNNCRIKSGVNSRQVGWGGKKSQETRFDVLLKYFKVNINCLIFYESKNKRQKYLFILNLNKRIEKF